MGTPTASAVIAGPTTSPTTSIRVVVIDGLLDRRKIMSYLVGLAGDDVTVVGHATDASSAVEAVNRLDATVALVEIQLPTVKGLETISALRDDNPNLQIIVCSFHHDAATRDSALSRGANAYLTKPISPRDLYPFLRSADLATSGGYSS
jgi:DNA-binding NarL/FixJ family response regulator